MKYDVIIVGAGPAGLKCAETLANSNLKILILEKNTRIGPKVCAGGLTNKDFKLIDLPSKLLDHSFNEAVLNTKLFRTSVRSKKNFIYTIDRERLADWQLKKIQNKPNITIRKNVKITQITDSQITTNENEIIDYDKLVGADGSLSMVRQHLKLNTSKRRLAMHYHVKTKHFNKIEFFIDSNLFHTGYAWIFPHQDHASVGCISDPKYLSPKQLSQNFQTWLKLRSINVKGSKLQAFPINSHYVGYRFQNIFLVGDAAGLGSELTGEGIYQALGSGQEVANIILNNDHEPTLMKHITARISRHNKTINFLNRSGKLRYLEYELLGLALKCRLLKSLLIKKET